jgi:snapalysin
MNGLAAAATAKVMAAVMVVGGAPVTQNYSFLVYLPGCSGTLIASDWAITARHCPTPGSVRVGSIDRTSGGSMVDVSGSVSHPRADVKLLHLSHSVGFDPVRIASSSGLPGTATRIIGWGITCRTRHCEPAPAKARELDTSIRSDNACPAINSGWEICTDNAGRGGACYGDSGGPELRKVGGEWQLIGATSRAGDGGSVCAAGPSIYTDVTSVRDWIAAKVGSLP